MCPVSSPLRIIVDARRCDHSPRQLCDWCSPFAADIAGRLHRHADGTEHRHAPPYTAEVHGAVVAYLDDGPTYPDGKPEPYDE